MHGLLNWLDARTGYRTLMHEALYERVPGGARWRYVWGSTLVYTFSVQLITGFFLWTAYSPSAQTAWESVYYIQEVMQAGWLVRGIHHFTAQAMIVLMALHLMQVIIDGAYKAPREINFWLGLVLMQIVLGLSLTGYLLPWDQKGYWATQVATNIMGITPGVGVEVQKLASGGNSYGHATLTRFFALHAGLLPALLIGFLALHIYVFRRHGITVPDPKRAPDTTFWPDQVLKDAVACLAVLATVLALTLWKGAELTAPADPSEQFSAARPEWYFLFLFQFLKYFKGTMEVVGAIYIPGAVMLVLVLMPILGRSKIGHRFNVFFMFAVLVAAGALTFIAIREDQQDPNYAAAVTDAEVQAHRVKELAQSPQGIGVAGAIELLRNDPKTQGAKLFAKNCAVCHRYDGKDGTGKPVEELVGDKLVPAVATATDLGKFGSREWVSGVLKDFKKHFEPTTHARFDGQEVKDRFTAGSMAEWSESNAKEMKPEDLAAIVEFIVDQSGVANPPTNPDLVAKGKKFFSDGSEEVQESCATCHKLQPRGEMKALGSGSGAPELTGYGSAEWLDSFISNPGDKRHYGKKNAMPGFADRLSRQDRKLLIDWMQHKWYEPAAKKGQ
ncbi:MAG: cytochrome b N-terminal domain-containing protein [Planctomycetales bacterium]